MFHAVKIVHGQTAERFGSFYVLDELLLKNILIHYYGNLIEPGFCYTGQHFFGQPLGITGCYNALIADVRNPVAHSIFTIKSRLMVIASPYSWLFTHLFQVISSTFFSLSNSSFA
jgi:hypothetical protein